MLDIYRRKYINPHTQKLVNVLITLDVTAGVGVGMRKFVHQNKLGAAF